MHCLEGSHSVVLEYHEKDDVGGGLEEMGLTEKARGYVVSPRGHSRDGEIRVGTPPQHQFWSR